MNKIRYITLCLALAAAVGAIAADTARAAGEKEQQLIDVLKADSPKAEKAITCKRLAIYGGKDSVDELAKLLPDGQLSSWARIALEAIPGPEADAALRDAMQKLGGRVLIGVINSVGIRRDAKAVDALAVRLKDSDAGVASAAALALGRIGNAPARKVLEQSLPISVSAVRSTVAEGCILSAERLLSEGKHDEAAKLYDKVRKADVPKQRIVEATRGAILARRSVGVPLLVEQLQSDDKAMFNIGLLAARELAGSETTEALVSLLSKATPKRRALLIVALAERDDPTVLPAMLKAAQEGPKVVRIAALGTMPSVGDASCVDTLLATAMDDDADLAQAAKDSLEKLPGKEVDADLAARLSRATGQKVRRILIELAGLRRIEATSELLKAADDPNVQTRAAALVALGATVGADKLAFLIERVVTPKKPEDAPAAQLALRAACIRMPDREACAAKLIAAMPQSDVPTECLMLEILGNVGGKKALTAVAAAAKSPAAKSPVAKSPLAKLPDKRLQDTASRILGKWETVDAVPVLLDLAKTLPDGKFKVRAMRGYIRIIRQSKLPVPEKLTMCRKALSAARRVQEKKLVLDILPRFQTPDSLALATASITSSDIRDAAASAALAIAAKIVDKHPAAVAKAMQKAIASGIQGDSLTNAKALSTRATGKLKK